MRIFFVSYLFFLLTSIVYAEFEYNSGNFSHYRFDPDEGDKTHKYFYGGNVLADYGDTYQILSDYYYRTKENGAQKGGYRPWDQSPHSNKNGPVRDKNGDDDSDGLPNYLEDQNGTNPDNPD